MIIKDCPMKVQIFSNKNSSAKNSKISGAGLSHSTAGVETKILLETFDSFGNKGLGGEASTIRIELVRDDQEENIEKNEIQENKDKNNKTTFTCDGDLYKIKKNEIRKITLESRNSDGSLRKTEKDNFIPIIKSKKTNEVLSNKNYSIKSLNNGLYEVEFFVDHEGEYFLEINQIFENTNEPKKIFWNT